MRVCLALQLPGIHLRPRNPVVFRGSYPFKDGEKAHLEEGFPLRCFQRFSLPNIATRQCFVNNRHTRGWSTPVLSSYLPSVTRSIDYTFTLYAERRWGACRIMYLIDSHSCE